jgi:3-hydroxyacyl-[acyl-carrier-protein] dehydratase
MDVQLPLDVVAIQQLLPHRYPFLLVDRVTEFEAHKRVARHQERHDQRAVLPRPFRGPPGDAGRARDRSARADRRHCSPSSRTARRLTGKLFYLVKIDNAKFSKHGRARRPAWCWRSRSSAPSATWPCTTGIARVGGEPVASADILCAEVKA